ncbi:MAG: exosome complex protein Rrp42 [Nitrososphaerota archaeon]
MYRIGGKPYPTKILHDKLYELILHEKRLDGRSPYESRQITLQTNVIEKADGSAQVSIGGTKIIAGIKAEVGSPYPDTPNQANMTVNAELLPLASRSFEPGPPDERAIELARVVDRCIRESKAIDLEKLVYIPGQKVAVLYIDIYVLDYDGNYFDPSVLAAVAALATAKIKKFEVTNGILKLVEGEYINIPMRRLPVSVTLGLFMDKIIVDPTAIEESALDTSLIVGWSTEDEIAAIQKNTPGRLPFNILEEAINISREVSIRYRKKLIENIGWSPELMS